jgi:hypothetical protein
MVSLFFPVAQQPNLGPGLLTVEVPTSHTLDRTPLKERSARHRGRYLQKRLTPMPSEEFEPAIPRPLGSNIPTNIILLRYSRKACYLPLFLSVTCHSHWPCGPRSGCATVRLLGLRVRILTGTRMFVYCVLSGRHICDGPITNPKSYRVWCLSVIV